MNLALAWETNVAITYAVDGYLPLAGAALVKYLKNLLPFGMNYGVVPWLDRKGYGALLLVFPLLLSF